MSISVQNEKIGRRVESVWRKPFTGEKGNGKWKRYGFELSAVYTARPSKRQFSQSCLLTFCEKCSKLAFNGLDFGIYICVIYVVRFVTTMWTLLGFSCNVNPTGNRIIGRPQLLSRGGWIDFGNFHWTKRGQTMIQEVFLVWPRVRRDRRNGLLVDCTSSWTFGGLGCRPTWGYLD